MKKYKEKGRRISTVLLSLMLCIALMPAGAFAFEGDGPSGDQPVIDQNVDASSETADEEQAVQEPSAGQDAAEPEANQPAGQPEGIKEPVVRAAEGEDPECAHANVQKVDEVPATCKDGKKGYYECPDCGKIFSDEACTQEITDPSTLVIKGDPSKHQYDGGKVTRKASPAQPGIYTYTCKVCGATKSEEFEYIEPINPGKVGKSFKLDGVKVKFKQKVVQKPEASTIIKPGRVWIKGGKKYMKVLWKNGSGVKRVDGVFIMRATGNSKTFVQVAKIPFKKYKNGIETVKIKTSYKDKSAKQKNKAYTYRVVSYIELSDYTYISHISDWASGRTSVSKLKNIYKGKVNKKSVTLQYNGTSKLKLKVTSPKKKFQPTKNRWSSSNKKVAKVSSKGKVTALKPGTATISCRSASGYVFKSKVTVVGAFKPGKPTLKVDYATTSSITLIWNKTKHATSYDVYKSNDGVKWDKPVNVKGTTHTFSGLTKDHRYTFYIVARNDNGPYVARSDNSSAINQKAVVKRRPMTLTGFPTSRKKTAGTDLSVTIKVKPPIGRKATLQKWNGEKWINKSTITLPKGTDKQSVKIAFPDSWWKGDEVTKWRLVVPATTTTDGFTTPAMKLTRKRRYQNPSGYIQISDTISKHGYNYYVSKVLVDSTSKKADHIEAFITTAKKYKGDPYKNNMTGAPGYGIDASGLIIQSLYGAGVDLWPIGPSTRPYNCVPSIKDSKFANVKYTSDRKNMMRGDLVFFKDKNGELTHVAIYLGNGSILHASPISGKVQVNSIQTVLDAKYKVDSVKRVFN